MGPKILGTYSNLPGMPRESSEWVFTKINGFQGFGSKDLSNAKDDKTKNDAMVNVYPLECPKPIIPLRQIKIHGHLSISIQNP